MMWTSSEAILVSKAILVIIYLSHKYLLRACFEEGAAVSAEKQEHTWLLIHLPNGAYVLLDRQNTIYTEIHILQSESYKEKYRTGMVPR